MFPAVSARNGAAERAHRPIVLENQSEIALADGAARLAFTLAPHLQIINYRRRFSPFPGI
jgi:hypothetical protein